MDDGLLSLKWNNHKTTFFEILKLLRDKASYTDATLAVDGKFYPVHKLVLSTCSEYFSDIFERTPCKSPVIVLKDVRSQDLESLLDYMYLGEVNVNQNDLALLLKTAECLRIKGLAVPDEEPANPFNYSSRKHSAFDLADSLKEIPPSKRRKEDLPSSSSIPLSSSTRVSTPPITSQSNIIVEPKSPRSGAEDISVKLEQDHEEEAYASESNLDIEIDSNKSETDASRLPNTSQPANSMTWEDGENSFPQESFGDSSNQQGKISGYTDAMSQFYAGTTEDNDSSCSSDLNKPLGPLNEFSMFGNKTDYSCPYCNRYCDTPSQYAIHVRAHTGERPFFCPYCQYRATQKHHIKSHLNRKHRDKLNS